MGKLKNHLIGLEDEFYSKAQEIISGSEHIDDFKSEIREYRDNLPLTSDDTFEGLLDEMWYDYWSEKGHE